ncbi:CLUMA_CG016667, isoform A [Clunio marinus]|uniref:CLUMA_CG016667, isoform A n=1 Tax=Clunio marinus TaxID=568069 RepID=A0A1J1IT17_9DIPT|nr:CLUMA_CG016667, isoform A [Clunio marinus]
MIRAFGSEVEQTPDSLYKVHPLKSAALHKMFSENEISLSWNLIPCASSALFTRTTFLTFSKKKKVICAIQNIKHVLQIMRKHQSTLLQAQNLSKLINLRGLKNIVRCNYC